VAIVFQSKVLVLEFRCYIKCFHQLLWLSVLDNVILKIINER